MPSDRRKARAVIVTLAVVVVVVVGTVVVRNQHRRPPHGIGTTVPATLHVGPSPCNVAQLEAFGTWWIGVAREPTSTGPIEGEVLRTGARTATFTDHGSGPVHLAPQAAEKRFLTCDVVS